MQKLVSRCEIPVDRIRNVFQGVKKSIEHPFDVVWKFRAGRKQAAAFFFLGFKLRSVASDAVKLSGTHGKVLGKWFKQLRIVCNHPYVRFLALHSFHSHPEACTVCDKVKHSRTTDSHLV